MIGTARGQDIELVIDDTLVDHLAAEGYQPEYGARELRRQIRQLVETRLAKGMLKGEVKEGDRVVFRYDKGEVTYKVEAKKPAKRRESPPSRRPPSRPGSRRQERQRQGGPGQARRAGQGQGGRDRQGRSRRAASGNGPSCRAPQRG